MYFVYILRCADQTFYTGICIDLKKRLLEHNSGKLGAKYTKVRRPVKLIYSKEYADRSTASKEEARIKKLTREQKKLFLTQNSLASNLIVDGTGSNDKKI